jgi:hypothetical protein
MRRLSVQKGCANALEVTIEEGQDLGDALFDEMLVLLAECVHSSPSGDDSVGSGNSFPENGVPISALHSVVAARFREVPDKVRLILVPQGEEIQVHDLAVGHRRFVFSPPFYAIGRSVTLIYHRGVASI